jgi:hypothetical protein
LLSRTTAAKVEKGFWNKEKEVPKKRVQSKKTFKSFFWKSGVIELYLYPISSLKNTIRLSADTIRKPADAIRLSADSLIVFWAFSKGEKNGLFLYSVCFSQRIENYALLRKSLQGNDERKVLGNKQKELGKV